MIHKMFTVYDSKAEAYLTPFCCQSTGVALRSFEETCNTPDHNFSKYPADFTLFEIGTYDDNKNFISQLTAPTNLGTALEYVKQKEIDFTQPSMLKPQSM